MSFGIPCLYTLLLTLSWAMQQFAIDADEPADPTVNMSAREKKMYELQQRLRQSRKANENAVIAEKRRQQVC